MLVFDALDLIELNLPHGAGLHSDVTELSIELYFEVLNVEIGFIDCQLALKALSALFVNYIDFLVELEMDGVLLLLRDGVNSFKNITPKVRLDFVELLLHHEVIIRNRMEFHIDHLAQI